MIGVATGLASLTVNLGCCVSAGALRQGSHCGLVTSCHVSVVKAHVYVSLRGVPVLARCFIPTAREKREGGPRSSAFPTWPSFKEGDDQSPGEGEDARAETGSHSPGPQAPSSEALLRGKAWP